MADVDSTQMANGSTREIPPDLHGADPEIKDARLRHLLSVVKHESLICGALARTAALSHCADADDWKRIFEVIAGHSEKIETAFSCYRDGLPIPDY